MPPRQKKVAPLPFSQVVAFCMPALTLVAAFCYRFLLLSDGSNLQSRRVSDRVAICSRATAPTRRAICNGCGHRYRCEGSRRAKYCCQ